MKKIILLFLAIALSSCGFQLKGKQDLAHLSAVQLRAAGELRDELVKQLKQQNVAVDDHAVVQLIVDDLTIKRRQSAIGNVGDAREVELNYLFSVNVKYENELVAAQTMTQSAYLQYQSNQYLGGSAEEDEVKNSLTTKSVQQILRFLAAHTQ